MHEAAQLVRKAELMRYLLAKYTLKECAKLMGVSYATIRKWASENDFMHELKELSNEVWSEVGTELKQLTSSIQGKLAEESENALTTLIEMMNDRSQKGVIRLKAAENILDRNPDTSKTSKVQTSGHLKIDPLMLVHAAATADEVDKFKREQKPKELTDGEY